MDAIGRDDPIDLGKPPITQGSLECVEPRQSEFARLLHVSDTAVKTRVEFAFQQLFYGDPVIEAIYFTFGEDMAYIWDSLHGDVRTEGMGLAMLITVKLDKKEEFDRLWRYALRYQRIEEGPAAGYFESNCGTSDGETVSCLDPFGMQEFAMALIFAHYRWGSAGDIDYESGALELLGVMLGKEAENGGAVVDGVTNVFDVDVCLPYDEPRGEGSTYTQPAVVMPAYYRQWASVTGLRFWKDAEGAGREFWQGAAHPTTGLMPVRAEFDGTPVAGWADFGPEVYRAQLNMALDWAWRSPDPWLSEESDRIIRFFSGRADDSFCRAMTLDGTYCYSSEETPALPIVNALTALAATDAGREAFIESLWSEIAVPTIASRYYGGLLYLIALMVAGGQFPVCDSG